MRGGTERLVLAPENQGGFHGGGVFVPGLKEWQHVDRQRDQGGQRLRGGKGDAILGKWCG